MTATHLLGASFDRRTEIVLINRPQMGGSATTMARGLAYGTNSADHLLNVPAGRMSAFEDRPNDFLEYLHANNIAAEGGSFIARHWYGRYLQKTLNDASSAATVKFTIRHQAVSSIRIVNNDRNIDTCELKFSEGEPIIADRVVLALGNFLPTNPPMADAQLLESNRYIRDPWSDGALNNICLDKPVLLIGTGLTMFDVVVSLNARADAEQKPFRIHAVSRRGLWPQSHRSHTSAPSFAAVPPNIFAKTTARAYLRAVRDHVSAVEKNGGDWRDVMVSLRPITPHLWGALQLPERKRFLRHLKPYWETHRHRAAPEIFNLVARCEKRGEMTSYAAQILGFDEYVDSIKVRLQVRGKGSGKRETITIEVGTVINCTGPSSDLYTEPLLAQMAALGLIAADPLRLGIEVADDYRVRDDRGMAGSGIYYVGPLLKARDWEATAVPELREHAKAAAQIVLQTLASCQHRLIA